jgi:DNA-directed RNA polymerase subunit beta'
MIKGKQGRFRENLLGKRVDYSARSVIVVGPELKLHQCGLPKKIALELFQPFIIRRLKELGLADTIRSAKKMLERKDEEVWDILEEVIQNHPVILNRAPTLHRMGIQAFEPVLIEGNAIRIHPLVCTGFNADFDGDQMAVHLPLSLEAQIEARTLMLSTNNVFSPANGKPIMAPTQDIVLGCYYLTVDGPGTYETLPEKDGRESIKAFGSVLEVFRAWSDRKVVTHQRIRVRLKGRSVVSPQGLEQATDNLIITTVGRVLFDDVLPKGMPFYNLPLKKRALSDVIVDCHKRLGLQATISLLDDLKSVGFKASTMAGLSLGKNDMRMPTHKAVILDKAQKEVEAVEQRREQGAITEKERYNQVIDIWSHAREAVGKEMMEELKNDRRPGQNYVNPIYLMADSGARGSIDQIRQLAGMRGLMAKPSGAIIETPIKANFREGLKVLEYFSSTHGARKGLADTALKTADSGYLTRKLTDVTQNVVVTCIDCGTNRGIVKGAVMKGERVEVPLAQNIRGRTSRQNIRDIITDELIVGENEVIFEEASHRIESLGFEKIQVRSPLTCDAPLGVCALCYGADLARGKQVEVGTAVGIIAAQSIGEPGTQLTMRTFHIGGTASRAVQEKDIQIRRPGTLRFRGLRTVESDTGEMVVLNRNGSVVLIDEKERELETHDIPLGAVMLLADGHEVSKVEAKKGLVLCTWDPHTSPLIADVSGMVAFEDIVEGETMKQEQEAGSRKKRMVIMEHKGALHPQIIVLDKDGTKLQQYHVPERAVIEIKEGQKIKAGTVLAKRPREVVGTQDITGGLPRVTELLEARTPKDPAVIAEIDGTVELGDKKRGKRIIIVRNEETGKEHAHLVPHGKYLRVHKGDRVRAGDPLVEGPLVPHDILRISGEDALYAYLQTEVQNVYRSQGVTIDDKHIEIIITQMLRKRRVEDAGDSDFLPGTVVDKNRFRAENRRIEEAQGKPATSEPLLLGITKASLQSESFISAASFQETTKVLTEAAIAGKVDQLVGLKENVILGHLIPAGTGFQDYHKTLIKHSFDLPTDAGKADGLAESASA